MSIEAPRNEIWLLGGFGLLAALTGVLAGVDPRLAIAGALGILFTFIALTNLTAGLALFTFLGFVVVLPNFAGQTLSVIKVAALPLLLSWLAIISREGGVRKTFMEVHPAIFMTMFLFIGWTLLSAAWAEDASSVLSSVFRYSLAMILVFVVYTAVRGERDLTMIVGAMVVGAFSAAVYGFLHPATQYGQLGRLTGTLGNPNELAAALVLGIGLAGGLAAISKSPLARISAIGAGLVCLIAILLTGSRGGLIALAVMLLASIVIARGRRLALTMVTMTVLLVGVGWMVMAAPREQRERLLHPGSGSGRTDIWTVGGRMVGANPIQGVGAGNFSVSSIHYLLRPGSLPNSRYIADTPEVAENMYLEVTAELGLVGLALFLTMIMFGLGCAMAALSKFDEIGERRLYTLTAAVAVALIGLLTADVFAAEEYARELWLLLGLGPALLAMAKRMEAAAAAA